MRFRVDWIGEYVELRETAGELADLLTGVGLTVDAVESWGDQSVLEVDITSNRPDAMSHVGIAREVAASCARELLAPDLGFQEDDGKPAEGAARVEIEAPDLCRRYAARVVEGVQVRTSPDWLGDRLLAVEMRPVNHVVDVTNYVLWELGHPLHAFDLDLLEGSCIVVRRARAGEKMTTLDGVERTLDPEMLVIADEKRPVALAGIMGGADTEISESTTRILLESAHFDPTSICRTARKLGLRTDASLRFEKGADPEVVVRALERTCHLLQRCGPGRPLLGTIDVYPRPWKSGEVPLRWDRAQALLGCGLDPHRLVDVLRRLGFEPRQERAGVYQVGVPSWRPDVTREVDLIEEVARHHGYDNIPSTLPQPSGAPPEREPGHVRRELLRDGLVAAGLLEAVPTSFISAGEDAAFRYRGEGEPLALENPLAERQGVMRGSLLPGLLDAAARNLARGVESVRLFEEGKRFWRDAETREPGEAWTVACLLHGPRPGAGHWTGGGTAGTDFYDLRGALEGGLEAAGFAEVRFEPGEHPVLHPSEAAAVLLGDVPLGCAGRLHPDRAAAAGLPDPVYVAELDLEPLLAAASREVRGESPSRFPWADRDLSLFLPEGTTYRQVREAILSLEQGDLVSVEPLDRYRGEGVPEGKLSLTVRLRYQSRARTLTQEEVAAETNAVVECLIGRLGAELRA
jgi:phenylalanyl-tRNA synthetase beta chain